jgi:hypothetical protein
MLFNWIRSMFQRWLRPGPWPNDAARRRAIINTVAPTFLVADRPVTPSMIRRFMADTEGLNPYETGRKLRDLIDAEFAEAA